MKHAVYSGSKAIYEDMVTSAKSLAANSDVDKIWFLIEDMVFPYDLPEYVTCINVSNQQFFKPDGPNMNSPYTYLAMMRAALCYVLPDVDVVLSLDADTICIQDVSDLWDIPLYGNYFAASKEPDRSYCDLLYTNTGVALYNLDALRKGKADEVISVLNSSHFNWVEQDVLNYLCQGRIVNMDGNYNANDWTEHNNPKILHFAGYSDWRDRPEVCLYRNMSWDDVRKKNQKKVLIAVPMFDKADPEAFKTIYDMDKPCKCDFAYVRGYGVSKARNDIAQKAINDDYDYVMMIDSDMSMPKDALTKMLEIDEDVVMGVCALRRAGNTDNVITNIYHDDGGIDYDHEFTAEEITQLVESGQYKVKVHGGGAACCLIKTDVFRKLKYPYYKTVEYDSGATLSEDLYFCEQCKHAGIPIYADARVMPGHVFRFIQGVI